MVAVDGAFSRMMEFNLAVSGVISSCPSLADMLLVLGETPCDLLRLFDLRNKATDGFGLPVAWNTQSSKRVHSRQYRNAVQRI
jgi:hypothetical protein